jgi:hypothetical protein
MAALDAGDDSTESDGGGDEKKIPCTAINPYESDPGRCCVPLYAYMIKINNNRRIERVRSHGDGSRSDAKETNVQVLAVKYWQCSTGSS